MMNTSYKEIYSQCENLVHTPNMESLIEKLKMMDKDELIEYILFLKEHKAFLREDRLKLQALDGVCLTIWACDSNFLIKLWEGSCESEYKKSREYALGKSYLDEFVKPLEREQSKEDCLHIINTGTPQTYRLCDDQDDRGHSVQLITQCCRIYDDDDTPLQAEVAIHIDYQKLVVESEEFLRKEKKRLEEKEEKRRELLVACNDCFARLNETCEKRMNYFSNQRNSDGTQYHSALEAMQRIIGIRRNYTTYYQDKKNAIKTNFDSIYSYADDYLLEFQNQEIEYAYEFSGVDLASGET